MIHSNEPSSSLDPLTRQALDWLDRLLTGEATVADTAALRCWCERSAAHAAAFADAVRLRHIVVQAARELAPSADAESVWFRARTLCWTMRPNRRRAVLAGALAAAAGGCLLVRPPLGLWPSLRQLTADYSTATGERRQLSLARGIAVDMNTRTSIAVRSAGGEPSIELICGEAAIEAELDDRRTLAVSARGGRTLANRARFNIRMHDSRPVTEVTCLDGEVRVEHHGRAAWLRPLQQISYDAEGLEPIVAADRAAVTGWQQGRLVFRDEELGKVIREVNRYRPGRLILVPVSRLAKRRVNASFHIGHLDDVVAEVERLSGAHGTSLPGGIVVFD